MQLSPKMLSGMANSEDPDQTAPSAVWSGSALFAYGIFSDTWLFEILGRLLLTPYHLFRMETKGFW